MCFDERKVPAAIVGVLSVITLIISLVMILLAIRFNNSGISTDLGSMGDYANVAFIALLTASIVALAASICGILTCKIANRCVAMCFGCTLLPAAVVIVVFGVMLTGVSHTDEAKLKEFCVKDYEEFEDTTTKDQWMKKLRETVEEVDYQVGTFVSAAMCSNLCPCDVTDVPESVRDEWRALESDSTKLAEYKRCLDASCEEDKLLVMMFDSTALAIMTEFDIPAYATFKQCFQDLKEGKRDTRQVPEEKVKEYQEMADKEEYKQALQFITYFEDNFTCSGICSTSLFYYTLPMSEGPPTTTCLLHMKTVIENNLTYMGLAATLCGLIMVVTWLCQYLLWKKYD